MSQENVKKIPDENSSLKNKVWQIDTCVYHISTVKPHLVATSEKKPTNYPYHLSSFVNVNHLNNKASGHFLQNQMSKINVYIKQPVTELELYQMTKGAASSTPTPAVHHKQMVSFKYHK